MTIGENIKKARKEAGLKQKELADAIGVSAQMISLYETDSRRPKYETLAKIAGAIRKKSGNYVYVYHLLDNNTELYTKILEEHNEDKYNEPSAKLVRNFNAVNKEGKEKILDYSDDIASNPKYKKSKED